MQWARWRSWIQAERERQFDIERYTACADGPPKPPFVVSALEIPDTDPLVGAFLEVVRAAGTRRSPVENEYERLAAVASGPTRARLEAVRVRWNVAYFNAMGVQHDADWMRFTAAETEFGFREQAHGRHVLRLSGAVIDLVCGLPTAVYAQLARATREAQNTYVRRPTQGHLRDLSYRLNSYLETRSVRSVLRAAVMRGVISVKTE